MAINAIKPKLQTPALLRLQQRLQGCLIRCTGQDGRINALESGIHPRKFDQAMKRLKLSHSAPFHCCVPCVIHGIAATRVKESTDNTRKHGFVLLGRVDLLKVPCQVECGDIGCQPKDTPGLKGWKLVASRLNTCGNTHSNRLCDTKVTIPMGISAWKSVVIKACHVIPVCVSMDPVQYRKRPLIKVDCFRFSAAAQLQELYCHAFIRAWITKFLHRCQLVDECLECALISQ